MLPGAVFSDLCVSDRDLNEESNLIAHCDENGELMLCGPLGRFPPKIARLKCLPSALQLPSMESQNHSRELYLSHGGIHLLEFLSKISLFTFFFLLYISRLVDICVKQSVLSALYGAPIFATSPSASSGLDLWNYRLLCRDSSLPSKR